MKSTVFDFDGTLVDGTEEAKMETLFRCIHTFGNKDLIAWLGDEQQRIAMYSSGSNTEQRLASFPAGRIKNDFLEYYRKEKENIFAEIVAASPRVAFYEEVPSILAQLSHKTLGIFTDSSTTQVKAVLERVKNIWKYFPNGHIITQNDVQKRKPDPEGLSMLLERMQITAQETDYIDDGWWGIEAAVRKEIHRIFLLERENETRWAKNDAQNLWLHTGRVIRTQTLDVLIQKRQPFVMIIRGKQYAGKWKVCSALKIPFAVINKDYVAESHKLWHKFHTPYNLEVRTQVYELFTKTAIERIRQYGYTCLDAPFTKQRDVEKMIEKLRSVYPNIPVLVVTVDAPQSDREERIQKSRALVGFMQLVPPRDVFELDYDDELNIAGNVQTMKISNTNSGNFQDTLRPLYKKIASMVS